MAGAAAGAAEGRGSDMSGAIDELEFGSSACVCPKCGKEVPHARRGIPCAQTRCPACGSLMKGKKCAEAEDD